MIKKRNQLITLIATPTKDLKGLNGVQTGAALFAAKIFNFGICDAGSATPDGNLPIA